VYVLKLLSVFFWYFLGQGRVALLANLSPDSGNLPNFESVWLQIFVLANIWRFFKIIGLQMFSFGEIHDLQICTYLLTYSYADLPFLILLMFQNS